MTTRPATPMPDWATDATYTSGPDTGIATKLEPVAGEFAPGFWRTYKPSARKLNWWMNKVGAWLEWLASYTIDTEIGGVYSPSGPINFAGAGVWITQQLVVGGPSTPLYAAGLSIVNGTFSVLTNGANFSGTVGIAGVASFTAPDGLSPCATFTGPANFNGTASHSANFASDVMFGGKLFVNNGGVAILPGGAELGIGGVDGLSVFSGGVHIWAGGLGVAGGASVLGGTTLDGVSCTGFASFTSGASFTGSSIIDIEQEIVLTGAGRIRRRVALASDADRHFDYGSADVVCFAGDGVLSANRTWTIDDTGAHDGAILHLSRRMETSGWSVTVKRSDGSTIGGLDVNHASMVLIRVAGTWQLLDWTRW
jgi:hypothetical protein